ncbi:HVO_2523 family zinc finger protein [Haloparvum sedimenti]|uniref:HVO_2523 family zinc finger protein n=1 Tax=Haloparvum sedimenti TaxID=1678448 RepID=UPI00071E8212
MASDPTDSTADSAADGAAASDSAAGDAAADACAVETPRGRPCPVCGASMRHRHCKYVCPEHGVVYDCSDTFY